MTRVRWGRVAVLVGAVCLVGGAANGDALAAIVRHRDADDFTGANGGMRLELKAIGVLPASELPLDTGTIRIGREGSTRRTDGSRRDGWSRHGLRAFTRAAGDGRAMILNGADTSAKTFDWETGRHVRNEIVTTYSDVRFERRDSTANWPTSGVAYSQMQSVSNDSLQRTAFFGTIVYFDGTRTPEAYIDSRRYTLDLASGIATPKLAK
jgi:hypothetical protein